MNQPLNIMAKINMMSFVYNTWKYKSQEKADWSKMTDDQREFIAWWGRHG